MENKKEIILQEVPYKIFKAYLESQKRKEKRLNKNLKAIEDYKGTKGD